MTEFRKGVTVLIPEDAGSICIMQAGSEGRCAIYIDRADADALGKLLRANSMEQRARKLAAERQERYRASHNALGNASHNAKVKGPTEEHRELAAKLGFDVAVEWAKYRDWQANVPAAKRHKNLTAGFNNWLRKAREFAPKVDKRERVAEAIWGDRAPSRQRMKTVNEIFSDGKPAIGATYERIS